MTTQTTVTTAANLENQANIDQVMATMTPPDTDTVKASTDTVIPSYAVLDLKQPAIHYEVLRDYFTYHGLDTQFTEIRDQVNPEIVYNVLIVGTTTDQTLGYYFTEGHVFFSPKDRYYDLVGVIAKGKLEADLDDYKMFSPKVRSFLASEIEKINSRKIVSTRLKDERNLKASNHLKSLIKPRPVN